MSSVNAPTEVSGIKYKLEFSRNLHETLSRITENDIWFMGDFSLKVGSENEGTVLKRETWKGMIN